MTTRERDFPFTLSRDASNGGDGLTFEGYAAVFNKPAAINDRDGEYDEVIAPRAFKRSIDRSKPVLMFNHGRHPVIGDMPLGNITDIYEDERGLFVRARLSDNWLVQPVRDAVADGAITGMSFRFEVVKDNWTERTGARRLRTLREVKVPEVGPVVWPAYTETTASVRSSLRSLESSVPGAFTVVLQQPTSPIVVNTDATGGAQFMTGGFSPSIVGTSPYVFTGGTPQNITFTPGAVVTPEATLSTPEVDGGATGGDRNDDSAVEAQIAQAVAPMSDVLVLQVDDDEVHFSARDENGVAGLFRVGYAIDAEQLTLDGAPEPVSALSSGVRDLIEDAATEVQPTTGPSEELAGNGPSDELAGTTDEAEAASRLNADHRAVMRYVHLSNAGLLS